MRLVYKFNVENKELYELCKVSKNLYNQALYALKTELRENDRWLSYYDLDKLMQKTLNLEGTVNYRLLKAQVSQQCIKTLSNNITAYVRSLKDYQKHPEKYTGKPRFPKYKKSVNQLIYPNQSCAIRNGQILFSKSLAVDIPQWDKYGKALKNFKVVRVNPNINKSLTIEVVYEVDGMVNDSLNPKLYASIDLGVSNIATLLLPEGRPLLYNGRPVKALNQLFNKRLAKFKSELNPKTYTSKKIKSLYEKRENRLNDFFHKLSRKIINELIDNKIANLVVGYNEGWKDSINLGKKNNQTFVCIPYLKFINCLKYKCELCGINFILHEESHTSKCDALAFESIEHHDSYLGRRVKRGLFRSSTGRLINADVNGALNILRKVVGDSPLVQGIVDRGVLFRPVRANGFLGKIVETCK